MDTIRKKPGTFALLACLIWCGVCWWQFAISFQQTTSSQDAIELRMTELGWQDASQWATSWTPAERPIDRIHPTTIAALILCTVVGACVWASSEWQVDRLFRRSRELTHLERTQEWVRNQKSQTVNSESKPDSKPK